MLIRHFPLLHHQYVGKVIWIWGNRKRSKSKVLWVHCRPELTGILDGSGDILSDLTGGLRKGIEATLARGDIIDMSLEVLTLAHIS
jgi:hypothetical protein